MTVAAVTGDKELFRTLEKMRTTAARRAVSLGMRKSGQLLAKKVKAAVPSRYKGVRKAIGWRMARTKFTNGVPGVKIGAGVGKRTKAKLKSLATSNAKRSGRKGVGIDSRNVHWWFMGTTNRRTKNDQYTGRMRPQARPVAVIASRHNGEIMTLLRIHTWAGIKKEIAKGKAFA